MKKMLWLDGERADGRSIPISPGSALWRGRGWFETVAVVGGEALNLSAHLQRLFCSAPDFPISHKKIIEELSIMAQEWGNEPGRLKFVVWEEDEQIRQASWIRELQPPTSDQYERGIELSVESKFRPPRWPLQNEKRTSYAGVIEARNRTDSWGVLYTNLDGRVWECGIANFFWWDGNSLRFPPRDDQILVGTVLNALVKKAKELEIPCKEESFMIDDVTRDGWIANSTSGLLPVRSIDGRSLQRLEPDPVRETLRPALASDKVIPLWKSG